MRVHIAGQFQLAAPADRKLFLVHQRFEPSPEGVSVDAVADRMAAFEADRDRMERLLETCSLEPGSSARADTYQLLDSRQFTVNAAFPRIIPDSFTGGALPQGIVKLDYLVDLSGLGHTGFCVA